VEAQGREPGTGDEVGQVHAFAVAVQEVTEQAAAGDLLG
jgi:hypothetical protein